MSSRYQEWLNHVFNHEVEAKKPQWYFGDDVSAFEASDNETTELISLTFLNAGKDLIKYSDEQVDQGIWYLTSTAASDFMFTLKSPEVLLAKRV